MRHFLCIQHQPEKIIIHHFKFSIMKKQKRQVSQSEAMKARWKRRIVIEKSYPESTAQWMAERLERLLDNVEPPFEEKCPEDVVRKLSKMYDSKDIEDCYEEIVSLYNDKILFSEDDYEKYALCLGLFIMYFVRSAVAC